MSIIECKAAILYEEGHPMTIETIRVRAPRRNEIRIKMISAGVCASDAHYAWGEHKFADIGHKCPVVLGHEAAGVIESVGEGVEGYAKGDPILLASSAQCNNCQWCKKADTNLCKNYQFVDAMSKADDKTLLDGTKLINFTGLGVYSEYLTVNQVSVIKVDARLNLENACILSCAVHTGYFSATHLAKVTPASVCAVWGLGGIGLNTIYGCKNNGAAVVIGIDTNDAKRTVAEQFGCTHFINPNMLNEPIEVYLQREFEGVDYAFDAIGHAKVIEAALASLTVNGTFTEIGLCGPTVKVEYPAFSLLFGRRIIGGILGNKKPSEGYPELVEMTIKGAYNLDRLVSNKFKLEQVNEAFETLKRGDCIRSVIVFD